jgi:flavin-dependent dehydrogenase
MAMLRKLLPDVEALKDVVWFGDNKRGACSSGNGSGSSDHNALAIKSYHKKIKEKRTIERKRSTDNTGAEWTEEIEDVEKDGLGGVSPKRYPFITKCAFVDGDYIVRENPPLIAGMVMRETFDDYLVKCACKKGVNLLEGYTVVDIREITCSSIVSSINHINDRKYSQGNNGEPQYRGKKKNGIFERSENAVSIESFRNYGKRAEIDLVVHHLEETQRKKKQEYESAVCNKKKEGKNSSNAEKAAGKREYGSKVNIRYKEKTVVARLVVCCDGALGRTSARLGLRKKRRKMGVAMEGEIWVEVDKLREHGTRVELLFGFIPDGYCWLFPKRDHISAGIFTKSTTLRWLKKYAQRMIARYDVTRDPKAVKWKGHPIPFFNYREKLHSEIAMIAGDAAGLTDPISGEGIAFSLLSGMIAADVASDYLRDTAMSLGNYSKRIHQEITDDWIWARLISRMMYRLPRLAFEKLMKNDEIYRYYALLVRGETTYRSVVSKMMKKFYRFS